MPDGGVCTFSDECCGGICVSNICAAIGTFPTADERLTLMAINRGRSDPATVKGPTSTIYPARPPVVSSYPLNRAARFHATNLQASGVTLMLTSPCTLKTDVATTGCDGSVACACATAVPLTCRNCANVQPINACGTNAFARIAYFTDGTGVAADAEVGAAGYPDSFSAVDGWFSEGAGVDNKRKTLLDQGVTSNVMGAGRAQGNNCWSSFDIVDAGLVAGLAIPRIPSGSIQPLGGSAGQPYRFYGTWVDSVLGAPLSLAAVVDGITYAMTLELGSPTLNSTWVADVVLNESCHRYWFVGTDASGTRFTYPTTGALEVPIGGSVCPASGP
jgi:hypothetical protein